MSDLATKIINAAASSEAKGLRLVDLDKNGNPRISTQHRKPAGAQLLWKGSKTARGVKAPQVDYVLAPAFGIAGPRDLVTQVLQEVGVRHVSTYLVTMENAGREGHEANLGATLTLDNGKLKVTEPQSAPVAALFEKRARAARSPTRRAELDEVQARMEATYQRYQSCHKGKTTKSKGEGRAGSPSRRRGGFEAAYNDADKKESHWKVNELSETGAGASKAQMQSPNAHNNTRFYLPGLKRAFVTFNSAYKNIAGKDAKAPEYVLQEEGLEKILTGARNAYAVLGETVPSDLKASLRERVLAYMNRTSTAKPKKGGKKAASPTTKTVTTRAASPSQSPRSPSPGGRSPGSPRARTPSPQHSPSPANSPVRGRGAPSKRNQALVDAMNKGKKGAAAPKGRAARQAVDETEESEQGTIESDQE